VTALSAPPRVAQLANYVGPTTGGLRVVVDELTRGHLAGGGAGLRLVPGPATTRLGDRQHRRVTVAGPRLPGSGGRYHVLLNRAKVRAELASFAPDLVEVHDQTTLIWVAGWARRSGVPSVLFSHERIDLAAARLLGLPVDQLAAAGRRWAALLASRFDAVVCASDYAAEPFRAAEAFHTGSTLLRRIPFGVDLDTFAPRPRTDEPPWPDRGLRLVLAGRLSPEKSPDIALDALAWLVALGVRAHLVVIGDGPLAPALHRRALRERLPVTFSGHLTDRRALARLVAGADVALAPGGCETFGLGVLEALACGTPVVTHPGGGSRELLDAGSGALASTGADMAAAALRLAGDPAAGRRARARAQQFPWRRTWTAVADLRAELIDSLTGPRVLPVASAHRNPDPAEAGCVAATGQEPFSVL